MTSAAGSAVTGVGSNGAQHATAAAADRPAGQTGVARVFFPQFEGLRATAALLVVVVHTSFASGFTLRSALGPYTARGDVGVAVFFIISGFLLYRPFAVAHFSGRPAPDARHFLLRRALRIVPLFWAALTVVYLFNGWSTVHGVSGIFETYSFLQVYTKQWVVHGISQAWSLDIEVVFYLLLPVYAAAMRRRRRSSSRQLRVELGALAALYLFSVAFRWYGLARPSGLTDTWHGWLPGWLDMFALGMGLAVLSAWSAATGWEPAWLRLPGADLMCWVAAAGVYAVFSTAVGLRKDPFFVGSISTELAGHALYGLFALLLALPAVFGLGRAGPVRWLLICRPIAFLGLISYGIYLWHQLVVQQLLKHTGFRLFASPYPQFFAAALGATVAVSALSYLVIERRGIAVGHQWVRQLREREVLRGSGAAAAQHPS